MPCCSSALGAGLQAAAVQGRAWACGIQKVRLGTTVLPQKAVTLHIVHYSELWKCARSRRFLIANNLFLATEIAVTAQFGLFSEGDRRKENPSTLKSTMLWPALYVGRDPVLEWVPWKATRLPTTDNYAEQQLLSWQRTAYSSHPIPALHSTRFTGVYLVFTSYYCHSAKLILESKGCFVKWRLQLPEYKSALLILPAVVSNTHLGQSSAGNRAGIQAGSAALSSVPACWLILDV